MGASNHFLKYRVEQSVGPSVCNGSPAAFSSLWRYEAAKNKLEALDRASNLQIDIEGMHSLLQEVSHGTTEHSIITKPGSKGSSRLWISVAAVNGAWDANFQKRMGPFAFED